MSDDNLLNKLDRFETKRNVNIQTNDNSDDKTKKERIVEILSKEVDPDLLMPHEIIKLPSKGLYYKDGISELEIEYLTAKDEELITTPSLIDNGSVLHKLLSRKIKTKGVNPSMLLPGDINACLLFLRISSYGHEYSVEVYDPRTGKPFKDKVNLHLLKFKEISELPNEQGHFNVYLPIKKKNVTFKLLTSGEEKYVVDNTNSQKELYGDDYVSLIEAKLKAHIVSIEGNNDRIYIDKFVNVLPAGDSLTLRKKISDVSPDIDMKYEFKAKDGYKFFATLNMGIDFFFPSI